MLYVTGPRALLSEGPALALTLSWPRSIEDTLRMIGRLVLQVHLREQRRREYRGRRDAGLHARRIGTAPAETRLAEAAVREAAFVGARDEAAVEIAMGAEVDRANGVRMRECCTGDREAGRSGAPHARAPKCSMPPPRASIASSVTGSNAFAM